MGVAAAGATPRRAGRRCARPRRRFRRRRRRRRRRRASPCSPARSVASGSWGRGPARTAPPSARRPQRLPLHARRPPRPRSRRSATSRGHPRDPRRRVRRRGPPPRRRRRRRRRRRSDSWSWSFASPGAAATATPRRRARARRSRAGRARAGGWTRSAILSRGGAWSAARPRSLGRSNQVVSRGGTLSHRAEEHSSSVRSSLVTRLSCAVARVRLRKIQEDEAKSRKVTWQCRKGKV